MLENLRHLHENPPSLYVSMSAEVQNSLSDMSTSDVHVSAGTPMDTILPMGGIDWNISVDDTQIDWDVDAVEQLEESGNSFGSYEIIDYNVDLKDSENGKDLLYDNTSSKKTEGVVPEASESEICWDISLENPQVDMLEDAVVPVVGIDKPNPTETSQSESFEERSQLLETEYRNKILDDLFEVLCNIFSNLCSLHMCPCEHLSIFACRSINTFLVFVCLSINVCVSNCVYLLFIFLMDIHTSEIKDWHYH